MQTTISYGKADISLYRTYATALDNLTRIPESSFTGRDNTLFAMNVTVEVLGDNFLPAYTQGDNRDVVATDTMKNFVLQKALAYDGATLEGLLYFLGDEFLRAYPQMQLLRLTGKEVPFTPVSVPRKGAFAPSEVLFSSTHGDRGLAVLEVKREGDSAKVGAHRCGRAGLQLIKITGSSFASFARDSFTTLPEQIDRPLFIYLDVGWTYADSEDMLNPASGRYVAAEQVRDLVQVVFHEFVSMSIQHLVHEMGTRLLKRFPQLASVSFEAQNRLWDTAAVSDENPKLKVYTDPRPPYGTIGLTLTRDR